MGHIVAKDCYRRLGSKIDGQAIRAPWSKNLRAILQELYSADEAEFICNLPNGLADTDRIARLTGYAGAALQGMLDSLCDRGLVIDLWVNGVYRYMPSPLVIGIFEFTMMRTGPDLDLPKIAGLFRDYMTGDGAFFAANFGDGQQVSIARALPYQESIASPVQAEVLDYESAARIIEASGRLAISMCACRHEKYHTGQKACAAPLETCSSFGTAADYLIRHGLARASSRSEMLENLERSRSFRLVLSADNVRQNISFICHCCRCCCNLLAGINRFGYPHAVVTSSYLAEPAAEICTGCGRCAAACPVSAITMQPAAGGEVGLPQQPHIDTALCLGCGVCGLSCPAGAVKLVKRGKRVIHPETTFERIILQALERGTFQHLLFDNPHSFTHQVMRMVLGAFLGLSPIKKALMSDLLRSKFLKAMNAGAALSGKGWVAQL